MNRILRQSLRVRIMTFSGTLFMVLAVLIVLSILFYVYRTERETWHARQTEAAHNAARTVADYLHQNENALFWLDKYEYDEITHNPAVLYEVLQDSTSFMEIVFVNEKGIPTYSAAKNQPTLANQFTILQSEWFQQASSGRNIYTRVQTSPQNESYTIFAMSSTHGGVVAAQIRMDPLWETVARIRFGETGSIYVVNLNGQVIAHPDREVVLSNQSIQDTKQFEAILRSPKREWIGDTLNFYGKRVVSVSTMVEGTNWVVISELPYQEAYATTIQASTLIPLGILILMAAATFVFREMLFRQILAPLNLLRLGAVQIGQGDLAHRITIANEDEFGQVMLAFNTMARQLEEREEQIKAKTGELQISESRYRAIVEDQTELICRFLPDGTLTFVNEAYCRYFNRTREDLIGHNFIPMIPPEDQSLIKSTFSKIAPGNPFITYEHRVLLENGKLRWQEWTDRGIWDAAGNLVEYASVGRDITDQRQAELELRQLNAELESRVQERTLAISQINASLVNEVNERKMAEEHARASLKEKEVLLKEIHHRVKNNLQIISSLLNLQSNQIQDPATLQTLRDSQARVRTMALIHEKLYQSKSLAKINFGEYVQSLSRDLFRSYQRGSGSVQLKVNAEEILFDLDRAVPCGLILNELITNALKYAFPQGRSGTLWVELLQEPENRVSLKVSDDGIGLPSNLDVRSTRSLGWQLVNSLISQIDGSLEIFNTAGTSIRVHFNL